MAEERSLLLRLQPADLQCTVCMGHYNYPCTLPCGHTFCRDCIQKYWREGGHCKCPICQDEYKSPPKLSKNTDLAALLEALHEQEPRSHDNCPECSGPGATKLCLPCMAPLCAEHQLLHRGNSASGRHLLVSLQNAGWSCKGHEQGVQYFCTAHGTPLCPICVLQHQGCKTEPLLELYKRNKEGLEKWIHDLDENITSKEKIIGNQKDAYREIQILICDMKDNLTRDFREMRDYLEKQERASFWRMQQEQETAKKAMSQEIQILMADIDCMKKVRVELQDRIENDWIAVLKDSRLEGSNLSAPNSKKQYALDENRLVDTTDTINKIKNSLMSHPLLEQVPCPPKQVFEQTLDLQSPLGIGMEMPSTKLPDRELPERSLNTLLQWATRISFDPQTVNCRLSLSQDCKAVTVTNKSNPYEGNKRRFTSSQVLCVEGFSTECCYWEFSTKDSDGWGVGAAAAEIGRGDKLGRNNLSWCLEWTKDRLCVWHNNEDIHILLTRPITVGILLDCQEKELKFYSVLADSEILIHCYKIDFQTQIFPAVWLFGLKAGNFLTIRDIQRISM